MVISAIAQFFVSVNYNMTDYLPEDAPSTEALQVMEDEFATSMTNAYVMVEDVTLMEALEVKEELIAIDGISDVLWLDDVTDIKVPLEYLDEEMVETYYKDGAALFAFTVRSGDEVAVTD